MKMATKMCVCVGGGGGGGGGGANLHVTASVVLNK